MPPPTFQPLIYKTVWMSDSIFTIGIAPIHPWEESRR